MCRHNCGLNSTLNKGISESIKRSSQSMRTPEDNHCKQCQETAYSAGVAPILLQASSDVNL